MPEAREPEREIVPAAACGDGRPLRVQPLGCVILAAVIVQTAVIGLAVLLFDIAPRAQWPVWLEALGFYGISGSVVSLVWARLIEPLLTSRTRDSHHWLSYLDLGMGFTAVLAFPIILLMILGKLCGLL